MIWRRLAYLASLLAGVSIGLGSWLLFTESGLRWSVDTIVRLSGGTFMVEDVHGRLAGQALFKGIQIKPADFTLSVDSMQLRLAPSGLLRIAVIINTAEAEGVLLSLAPSSRSPHTPKDSPPGGPLSLPLGIEIGRLTIKGLDVAPSEPSDPVFIQTVQFTGKIQRDKVSIENLTLHNATGQLEMEGELKLAPVQLFEARTAWSINIRGMPPLTGRGTLEGSLFEIRTHQEVLEPFASAVSGSLRMDGETDRWEASAGLHEFDPGKIFFDRPGGNITGYFEGSGSFESFTVIGDLAASGIEGQGDVPIHVDLEGNRIGKRWELARFTAHVPGTSSRISASGHYTPEETAPEVEILTSWAGLRWPIMAADSFLDSPAGELAIRIKDGGFGAELKGILGAAGHGPKPFHVLAAGSGNDVTIDEAAFSIGSAQLTARGSLSDRWDGFWRVIVPDTGVFRPGAHGRLDIKGRLEGERSLPFLTADLLGHDLFDDGVSIEAVEGALQVPLAGGRISEIRLSLKGLEYGKLRFEDLILTGLGSADSHSLKVEVKNSPFLNTMFMEGRTIGSRWEGTAQAEALAGILSAEGTLSWAESLSWIGSLKAAGLKPALVWPHSPEDLSLEAVFTGTEREAVRRTDIHVPRAEGRFRDIPFKASASARLLGVDVQLEDAEFVWGSARFQAHGSLEEEWDLGWDLSISDLGRMLESGTGNAEIHGQVTGPRTVPVLDLSMNAKDLGYEKVRTGQVSAEGTISADEGFPLSFRISSGPVTAGSVVTGEIEAKGTAKDGDHQIFLRTSNLAGSEADVSIRGRVSGKTWTGTVSTGLMRGGIELDGSVSWEKGISWRAGLRGDGLDPGAVASGWPGTLRARMTAEGSFIEGELSSDIDLVLLEGTLRGLDASGEARYTIRPDEHQVNIPSLKVGGSILKAFLRTGPTIQGTWSLTVEDINAFLPGMRGAVRSTGEVAGAVSSPSVMTSVYASNLSGNGWALESVSAEARNNETNRESVRFTVKASGLSLGPFLADEGTLEIEGTLREHDIVLGVRYPEGVASMHLAGGLQGSSWNGVLDRTDLIHRSAGVWSLDKTSRLELSPIRGKVEPLCIVSDQSRFCIDAAWEDDGGKAALSLASVPLSLLTPGQSAPLKAEGYLQGDAALGTDGKNWRGTAKFSSSGGSILYPTGLGRWASLNFRNAVFSSSLEEGGLFGSFQTDLGPEGNQDQVTWKVGLPGLAVPFPAGALTGQAVEGSLRARIADMGFIQAFAPELEEPAGVFTASLDLVGTLGAPVIHGSVSLLDGSAKVPLLGLSLAPVEGRLKSDRQGGVFFEGTVGSGPGRIDMEGTSTALATEAMVFKISVRGEDFMAARTPIISLTLSPDLLLSTEGDLFNLTGTVRIPEATFKPIEVTSMNTLSPDVVVVDAGVPSSSGSSPGIRGDLTFILEDKVHFEGFGLTGRVSGSVRIIEEPGKLLSATGDLTIADGQYRAYGQKLNIERGRIIFSGGPVDNPGLDIRAVRRSGEILAGVQVGGTIMAPEVSLFSEPPMDQADALSYLLLGKPLRRASGDEGQVLAAAALTMGLTRGEALAARIGRSFGFEEVTVQTESDVEESAIVVGRYLTPRVYVRYGIGLFQAFNIFQFGYRISDRFLLQGESGVQTGTDLFYTIEK